MNIIEAIQKCEQGYLITHKFKKDRFLKYGNLGIFYEYLIINGFPEFQTSVLNFSYHEIITISWEIVDNKWNL